MEPTQEEVARRDAELDESAREYYRSLPVEDTIDTVPQADARRILLSSFSVIKARRPDVHYFNELLIEYRTADGSAGRVVPNNFVAVHPEPINAGNSFDLSEQTARPLLALEYVSEYRRPEFEQNRGKFERDLRIPYYLRVYPHDGRIAMFSLRDDGYTPAQLNAEGRFAVPELESEFGVVDGTVRVWFRGKLVPLIAELWQQRNEALAELASLRDECEADEMRAESERGAALAVETEIAKLREELAKAKGSPS